MADKTIGELPRASGLTRESLFVTENGGRAESASGADIEALVERFAGPYVAAAEESAKDAADVALHPPILKDGDDHWWTWSKEANDYVRSDADAGVSVQVGKVTTGLPGSEAKVTNVGTSTDPVFEFEIPAGKKGETGNKGDQGDKGDAATIEIGTVTTGNPGSKASVTNRGTKNAAILDITIPTGETGPAGGVDSVNGAQGDVIIGGTNYAINSSPKWWPNWKTLIANMPNITSNLLQTHLPDDVKSTDTFVCSFEIEFSGMSKGTGGTFLIDFLAHTDKGWSQQLTVKGPKFNEPPEDGVYPITLTITIPALDEYLPIEHIVVCFRIFYCGEGTKYRIRRGKMERGNVATDWSPNFENIVTSVNGMTGDVIIGSQHRYTVRWDQINNTMTRLNDAAAITTDTKNFGHFGAVNNDYDNPFDQIYPWSGRRLCNIDIEVYSKLVSTQSLRDCVVAWEGDPYFSHNHKYGVWVYTPEFWGRSWISGANRFFEVTDIESIGYIHYPESIKGRWHGVETNVSVDGVEKNVLLPLADGIPIALYSRDRMHTLAKNYGATLDSIYTLDADALLFLVEYANMDTKSVLGNGLSGFRIVRSNSPVSIEGNVITVPKSNMADDVVVGSIVCFHTDNYSESCNLGRYKVTKVEDADEGKKITLEGELNPSITTNSYWSVLGMINTKDEQIGSKSGYIGTDSKSIAYYRGLEMYGNMFLYILGIYRQSNTVHIWVAKDVYDADDVDELDINKHIDTGLKLTDQSGGWAMALGRHQNFSAAPFCTEVGGDSTKPIGGYMWLPPASHADSILFSGSCATFGNSGSTFSCNWFNGRTQSAWNFSARPVLKIPR